jgi:hypothetical protein
MGDRKKNRGNGPASKIPRDSLTYGIVEVHTGTTYQVYETCADLHRLHTIRGQFQNVKGFARVLQGFRDDADAEEEA